MLSGHQNNFMRLLALQTLRSSFRFHAFKQHFTQIENKTAFPDLSGKAVASRPCLRRTWR